MSDYIFTAETLDGKTVEGFYCKYQFNKDGLFLPAIQQIKEWDTGDYLEYIEVRPSSVRLNTEIICDQAEQIDNLKAEVERLRGDGWIGVKERLPDKNIAVIVHISSGDIDVRVLGICDDDPNGLWYCYKGADEPLRFNEVTHWRPLPEPPRGENGGEDDLSRVQQRT